MSHRYDLEVQEPRVVSLLGKLKSPEPSSLSRKRKTLSNTPPIGKKHSTGKNDPNVHTSKRVTEYSGEHLTVAARKLFCKACSEILSVKTLYRMILLIISCFRKTLLNIFNEQQQGCLEDYAETSIMLQYNTQ